MPVSIERTVVGMWSENTYLIQKDGIGLVVDPGDEFEKIRSDLLMNAVTVVGVVNTHAHFDHVGAVQLFRQVYQVPFYLRSEDERLLKQANLYRRLAGGKGVILTPSVDGYLNAMQEIKVRDVAVEILHTPGHTEGSVCLVVENEAIVGDLFFKKAVGRTDLPGGNKQQLQESVRMMLKRFANFRIHPGHGDSFVLNNEVIKDIEAILHANQD